MKTALFQVVVDDGHVTVTEAPLFIQDAQASWHELANAVEQLIDRKIGRANIPLAVAASVALVMRERDRREASLLAALHARPVHEVETPVARPLGVPALYHEADATPVDDVMVSLPFRLVSLAADHVAGTACNDAQRDLAAELRTRAMHAIMGAQLGTPRA